MKSIGNAAASTSASGLTSASVSAPRLAARARHDSVPVTATRASVVRPLRRMTVSMRSRLFWRRSAAAAGIYSSAVLGFVGTVVALHLFSTRTFGLYALVLAATGFFQSFLDVTVEEALIKFGFRFTTREDWGRLRRLFTSAIAFKLVGGVLAAAAIALLGPTILHKQGLSTALYVAALLPLAQCVENVGGVGLILRGRYDVRGFFLFTSMALRLTAIAVAAPHGLTATIAAIVAAQAVATAAVCSAGWLAYRRFPRAQATPLGNERRTILSFVMQSSIASGVTSLTTPLPILVFTPDIARLLFSAKNLGAVDATRIVIIAGGLRMIFGWTKSFPVSIGRPNLRIWTHGVEMLVLVPLAGIFGAAWGATGAAGAVLASSVAFCAYWAVLYVRIRREPPEPAQRPLEAAVA